MSDKPIINKSKQKSIRQFLRNNQTDAEAVLWRYLKGKELGVKFIRQFGIENYIVDFCCRNKKLIIEIDGGVHNDLEVKINDENRTKDLERFGYKVIRFTNQEVLNNPETVLTKIKAFL